MIPVVVLELLSKNVKNRFVKPRIKCIAYIKSNFDILSKEDKKLFLVEKICIIDFVKIYNRNGTVIKNIKHKFVQVLYRTRDLLYVLRSIRNIFNRFDEIHIYKNQCSFVSLKLENGYADLADFGIEMFVVVQGRFNR